MTQHLPSGSQNVRSISSIVTILLVILFVFSGVTIALAPQAGASALASTPTLYFSPNPIEVGLGDVGDVDIIVDNRHSKA